MKLSKGILSMSLALSVALVPGLADAKGAPTTEAPKVEVLPKANDNTNERSMKPAKVESSSNAKILNAQGKEVGKRTFKSNTLNDKSMVQAAAATRVVTVLAVADEEYRAQYSDWQTRIQNAVESADNAFYRDHDIDFQVHALGNWYSQGSNASQILSDLSNDWSGYSYDFVVGFTRDANFDAGGIAYVYSSAPSGSAFSVNLDQGTTNTWHAAQHEFSHNFGLGHDPQGSGIRCIMNYDYSYSVDYWDQDHDNQIEQNEYWYGS